MRVLSFIADPANATPDSSGTVAWEDIVTGLSKEGITDAQVEHAINVLLERDQIYEPILGRLKVTNK